MFLRQAKKEDLDCIMQILLEGKEALASLKIDQWQGLYPQREVIENDIHRGESYVVIDTQSNILATAMISFRGEEDYHQIYSGNWLTPSFPDNPCYAVAHRIAVSKSARGKGLARYILNEAEQLASCADKLSLRIDTHPGNLPMRSILDASGHTHCGIIHVRHAEGLTRERVAYEKLLN